MDKPLWVTYAWADNTENDFDYLIQEIEAHGIPTKYDKIAIVPGQHIWSQIDKHIDASIISGWAYLITPASLASKACQEELAYALQEALSKEGSNLPIIGLLHNVSVSDLPKSLSTRLLVSLNDPNWKEAIKSGINQVPPPRSASQQAPYVFKVHENYCGVIGRNAIEFRPRFGELSYWRVGATKEGKFLSYGQGPSNGGAHSLTKLTAIESSIKILDDDYSYFGQEGPLTPSRSAYIVFDGELPNFVFFGVASAPYSADLHNYMFFSKTGKPPRGFPS
ncbi:toll/interleukin-1 receptor domain-containing protein [Pseudomonas sp. M47T1]|uniref:toll/interleukin-1 receptor domain-containing protein n=1 Tax=Pseudomonas sp. M47T1 TaxID=1179778 RepID=UPI0012F85253|nr:toll/interleukin-1 receptor domain-containing protein [Pseudomonas sp. M47T1]